jgi:hypothetical protein
VRHLVVEGEGEGGWAILVDGHGRVVREVGLERHLEHVVAADLEKKFWREFQFSNFGANFKCRTRIGFASSFGGNFKFKSTGFGRQSDVPVLSNLVEFAGFENLHLAGF